MLKLLCIETGNVFVLPDEEALRIKKTDYANHYEILDAGIQEKQDIVTLSENEIKDLLIKKEEKIEQENQKELKAEESQQPKELPKVEHIDLEKLTNHELIGLCKRLGLKGNKNNNRATLLNTIKNSGKI